MNTQTIVFGTDGWRALMDQAFTDANVVRIAHAFVRYYSIHCAGASRTIAIAYDGRRNSRRYASLFADVVSSHGYEVLLSSDVVPTPVLSFAVREHGCGAGVMITASHNPPQYNGIKFKASYGGPFMSEETKKVEEQIRPDEEAYEPVPGSIRVCDFLPPYVAQLKRLVDFGALRSYAERSSNHAAVMIDSMGGAGGTLLEDLLTECGWRAQTLFGTPDAEFYGRLPEPVSKNLEPLKYNVQVTDALFGIATDGDADRCSVVYDDGEWMNAQETILAIVKHLHEQKHWTGGIIKTASVTDKLRLLAERWKAPVYETHVGFKYITEIMLSHDCMFGGEESGGFGYKGHIPERDGILSGLIFAEMIAQTGKSLHTLVGEIRDAAGTLHYRRIDAHYDKPGRASLLPDIANAGLKEIAGFPVISVVRYEELGMLTGLKLVCGDCRWLLLRTSQTEPLVRLYAEGQNDAEVDALLAAGGALAGI